jgi:uncharacterized protein
MPEHTNRLIDETSPYLLQHAHNPVDWHPWGPEALARAQAEHKPILLSIGYSACHWCHVMERESFENPEIAALMNRHFVNIKVDREERPDLDGIYMAATQALNGGQGGWPMTVFLTPDQRPFFAGTYFPPDDRWGRPGLRSLLTQLAELWEGQREQLAAQAAQLTELLQQQTKARPGGGVGEAEIRQAVADLARTFDSTYGGFTPAPKFPPSASLLLLFRQYHRGPDPDLLKMATQTLDAMAEGGIYDQIGGGFMRYATDERWLVPHFEKMLYDNAQLTRAYLEGYQVSGNPAYARIAREVLDYVLREMTGPEGGFYSATDADSEGVEGKFYVWTPAEVEAVLGADEGGRLCAYYDITEEGNWEGKSIPHVPRSLERVAARLGIPADAFRRSLEAGRAALYEARRRRVPPGLDDKVLTAWNGLMLGAMAEGARVLREPRYLAAAARTADFLLAHLWRPDGGLFRTYRNGQAHLDAYLEDYAFLAGGLIDLYEAGGEARYLHQAAALAERILRDFGDPAEGLFDTAAGHEPLILRQRQGTDGAVPSANAAAASALARLGVHDDRPAWREAAALAIQAYGRAIREAPRAFASTLHVLDFLLEGPVEAALIGTPGETWYDSLLDALARVYLPNRILGHHDPAAGGSDLPLLQGKALVGGRAALYICREYACQAPVTDPAEVERAVRTQPAAARRVGIASRRAGRATAGATAAWAGGFPALVQHGFGPLGSTGLRVSRLGFGGYRVDDDTPEHQAALEAALEGGCNLIDTSTNYTDGASERLIGAVLADRIRSGRLSRAAVVVISKLGYVQGQNFGLAKEREAAGQPFPEMVKVGEDLWHCLHPAWLEDQFARSLDRLGLETLDVCLLHNPEYFLSQAAERGETQQDDLRREFFRRLTEAFRFLEAQVEAGRIAWYGVSSNTAAAPPDDPAATSLSLMLDAAEAAGGPRHHFRVLQLPLNLVESGAVRQPNTGPGGGRTVLEWAAEQGIGVLTNRPLNAMKGRAMLRLADFPEAGEAAPEPIAESARRVAALEDEFRTGIAARVRAADGGPPPSEWFRWADQLRAIAGQIQGLDHWSQIETYMITPAVAQVVSVLDQGLAGQPLAETWTAWRDRYLPALDALLNAHAVQAAQQSQARSNQVTAAINPHLPLARRGEPLSRKAVWVVASTPGVSAVLLGMRHPEYVADGMSVLAWPPLPDVGRVYDSVAAMR